jgi:Invasion associated locus B (IalB) protein
MPRASAGRAERIVICTMGAILPGFALSGECYGTGMRRDQRSRLILLVILAFPLTVSNAAAATKGKPGEVPQTSTASQRLGTADGWTAYVYKEKSGQVCYIDGEPQRSEPAKMKRKQPRATVTHRPDEKVANVINFVEGYPLKEGSDVSLDIGGTKFDLFTKGDSAWARTSDLDKMIVETMAKGKQAVVTGTPQKGPPTTDAYSLAGFAQALAMIDKTCGIRR